MEPKEEEVSILSKIGILSETELLFNSMSEKKERKSSDGESLV